MNTLATEFAGWDGFYGIVGSAAGSLIGLQFVVMTLIATRPVQRAADAGAAFATPTIIHFSTVLLLSAVLRAPWQAVVPGAVSCGAIGFAGVIYATIVGRRIRKQAAYKPEFEDWLFHLILPLVSYLMLAASPFAAPAYAREVLFGVGIAALLLLFTGIHNAWDAVTYHIFTEKPDSGSPNRHVQKSDQNKQGSKHGH